MICIDYGAANIAIWNIARYKSKSIMSRDICDIHFMLQNLVKNLISDRAILRCLSHPNIDEDDRWVEKLRRFGKFWKKLMYWMESIFNLLISNVSNLLVACWANFWEFLNPHKTKLRIEPRTLARSGLKNHGTRTDKNTSFKERENFSGSL